MLERVVRWFVWRNRKIPAPPQSMGMRRWTEFLQSPMMEQILEAKNTHNANQLPKNLGTWRMVFSTACDIWDELESLELIPTNVAHIQHGPLKFLWPTMCLLIKGTYNVKENIDLGHVLKEEPEAFLLHAVADVACPLSFFHLVLHMFPHQARMKCHVKQRLPLAVAAAAPAPTHHLAAPPPNYRLEAILRLYPDAVRVPDSEGTFPLHLAAQNGYWSNIDVLFQLAPEILERRAGPMNLTPFMLAAIKSSSSAQQSSRGSSHENIMYNLLLRDPTVVQEFLH